MNACCPVCGYPDVLRDDLIVKRDGKRRRRKERDFVLQLTLPFE
jgi:hypothetical protein